MIEHRDIFPYSDAKAFLDQTEARNERTALAIKLSGPSGEFMKIWRPALLVALTLSLGVLAGCVNTAAKRTADGGLELDLAPSKDEGFVVLKVVSTQPISLINPKWQSIKVSSKVGNDEIIDITPTFNMLLGRYVPTESLYFAKLKSGVYEITGMGSVGPGPGLLLALLASDSATVEKNLPHFVVQGGKLANLGTIVYAPEIKSEQLERMILLNGPAGKKAAREALISESNRLDIPLVEEGGWDLSITSKVEAERLAEARLLVSAQNIQITSHGLVSGTHLGVLLRRSGPQAWTRETIDTISRLGSVSYSVNGSAIVGGDYGEYFIKSKGGEWRYYRMPKESDRVAHIEPREDGSAIFIMANLMRTRVLFKKSLDGDEPPAEIAKTDSPPDLLLSTNKELIFVWNIPGLTREVEITRIDKKTLGVSKQKEPFWVLDWQYLPDDTVILSRMNGFSLYKSFWTKGLQTWEHTNEPGPISSFWFDAQNGLSLEPSPGFLMVSNQLRSTSDGGKTWTHLGKALDTVHYAGRIVYADANEVLLQSRFFLF